MTMSYVAQDLIDRADQARQSAQNTIRALKENQNLTDDARSREIAQTRTDLFARVEELRKEYEAKLDAEDDRLRRYISSPLAAGVDRVAVDASYRDALERARSTEPAAPDQLRQIYRDARSVSDSLQQQAALVVALDREDIEVINAYIGDHPTTGRDIEALFGLMQQRSGQAALMIAAHFAPIV